MVDPESPAFMQVKNEGVMLRLLIQPGAKRSEIAGPTGDGFLKIRVNAPAVEGKANKELVRFLSELFAMRKSDIAIISGELARKKKVMFIGLRAEDVFARLSLAGK